MNNGLPARLDEIAHAPLLLIASDFDGTVAPIMPTPDLAEADRSVVVALQSLARMPQTHVAMISGRALLDLAARTRDVERLHLIGSHGSEFEPGVAIPLATDVEGLLCRLKKEIVAIAARVPGSLVEHKPASLAFHYRNVVDVVAADAVSEILLGPGSLPGVFVRRGKKVVELGVVPTDKGRALSRLRQRSGATAVLFLGDDETDEDAFATLGGPDVGVKIGPGDSRAEFHAEDPIEVARILAQVADRRADWLAGSHATPIEKHSILSDQRTVALLDGAARVAWMCLPRVDSPAIFAELLGGPTAGFFEIRPVDAVLAPSQRYSDDTLILETHWPAVTVTDYLETGDGRAFQRAGRTDLLRVIEGEGRVRIRFAPRLDFGRMETRMRVDPQGIKVDGAVDGLVLRAPDLPWNIIDEGRHQTAIAEFDLNGRPTLLELRYGTLSMEPDPLPEAARREHTRRFWKSWSSSLTLPRLARDLVLRSALVLRALSYGPTGAIVAAATTSLPEYVGGVRNWDYRYCWPRDAAMVTSALLKLGVTQPASELLDWVLSILDKSEPGALLRPVYTVTGGHLGPEGEVLELTGYHGSRPVRIGNLAAQQVQLDMFGPIADLVARLAELGQAISSEHWRMLETMVDTIARRWREPDHGIWEARRPRQHYVHTKVMCWQTVDRALFVARELGRRCAEWSDLRNEIAADVLTRGYNPRDRSFHAAYDDVEADAAVLAVGLSGLLATDDPRFVGTVDTIERKLSAGPTVYRYRYDDGLPGANAGFHLCTGWLIEAYARMGRLDAAHALFERFCKLVGPTGLLSEAYDPNERAALGNFPQAYSHLALIDAASILSAYG